eukprot:gene21872-28904_t
MPVRSPDWPMPKATKKKRKEELGRGTKETATKQLKGTRKSITSQEKNEGELFIVSVDALTAYFIAVEFFRASFYAPADSS